uniref:Uncharacterized protein n=1 Tax=Picea sitchensis TaxID=3332 RepID=A9NLI9_PICSI|nr:unknown [Picea sitchensis]
MGNWGSQESSNCVNPKDMRFTHEDINSKFTDGVTKLEDTVADIRAGSLDPKNLGPLDVHRGQNGEIWCENNRRLWVLRRAGVRSIEVKYKNNDFRSRSLGDQTREKLRDANFLPRIRGSAA